MFLLAELLAFLWALTSYGIFLLAFFGWVSAGTSWSVFTVALIIGWLTIKRSKSTLDKINFRSTDDHRNTYFWASILFIVTILIFFSHVLFLPPLATDDLVYHLLVPKEMLRTGHLYLSPFNLNSNFLMLFEFPLVLFESIGISSHAGNYLVLLALGIALCSFAHQHTKLPPWVALLLIGALALTPSVYDLAKSAYVELFQTLLIVLGLGRYLAHLNSDSTAQQPPNSKDTIGIGIGGASAHWIMTCIWLGLACATRYTAVLVLLLVFAWEFFRKKDRKKIYLSLFAGLLVASPWYLKNYLFTENPFFPMAGILIPSEYLSDLRSIYYTSLLSGYTYGREVLDYILLPFRVLAGWNEPGKPGVLGFGGQLSVLFALAAPGVLFAERRYYVISTIALIFVAIWIPFSQQVRFLICFLTLPILLGSGFLWKKGGSYRILFLLILACAMVQNSANIFMKLKTERTWEFLAGSLGHREYMDQHLPNIYQMAVLANRNVKPEDSKIFAVGLFGRAYYFDAYVLANTYYDTEIFDRSFNDGRFESQVLSNFLNQQNITHVLIDWQFYQIGLPVGKEYQYDQVFSFIEAEFDIIEGRNIFVLYAKKAKN